MDSDTELSPTPLITRFEPLRANRMRVHLDDESTIDIPVDLFTTENLHRGDPVDEKLRATLEEGALRWRAREAALHLLSHRARSKAELRTRLRQKSFPAAVIRTCLDDLQDRGLIDDDAFARTFIRDRLRLKPKGRRLLAAELAKRGITRDASGEAIDEVFDEEGASDDDLAEAAALAWLRRQPVSIVQALGTTEFTEDRERARRRLRGYLARRGFSGGAAYRAGEVATREAAAAEPPESSGP